ncbi:hypothetical protein Tco_1144015 [Tanacetum coccineum]
MVRYLFTMALDSFHSSLSQLELDTFCNDYGIGEEFGSVLSGLNESIYDFPQGKIGIYTRFIEFANFRLPLPTFFLSVLEHFRMHISQFTVLGASRISHFKIICRVHVGTPTVPLFCQFYLVSKLPTGWITIENRQKKKDVAVPSCHTEPFDSLKRWIDRFFWVEEKHDLIETNLLLII